MTQNDETLRSVELFQDLTDKELQEIEKRCEWRSYPPHVHLIDKMSMAKDVFFIVRGGARVTNFADNGKEIAFADLPAGSCFGELAAIDERPRSADVITIYSSMIASMDHETFWSVVRDYPTVAYHLLKRLSRMVRSSSSRIFDLSVLSAHIRVYRELYSLAQNRGIKDGMGRISPIPIHSDLASRVSTTRETVARIMSELNRKEIVVKGRNVLVVKDIEAFKELCEFEEGIDLL